MLALGPITELQVREIVFIRVLCLAAREGRLTYVEVDLHGFCAVLGGRPLVGDLVVCIVFIIPLDKFAKIEKVSIKLNAAPSKVSIFRHLETCRGQSYEAYNHEC
jgi:hypothetical protein